jgi:aspartate racemase
MGAAHRHVGILAHSVEGAALCLRSLCHEGFTELGPHTHPDVTLDCIALSESMPAWDAGDYETILAILSTSLERLAAAGADFFVCPDNTAHIALERARDPLPLPGLHIAEVVADRAARQGFTRIGILGTRYLMESAVYPDALGRRGITAELPDPSDRETVNRVIFDELVNGVFTESSRVEYLRIIDLLAARGCDAVALVCTEIPLLVSPDTSPLPTLDSTRLLARAGFDVAVGTRALPNWRGGSLAH